MSEKVLNEDTWPEEAQAVINDVKYHVKAIKTSETIKNNDQKIYLNLTTLENRNFCVELSGHGFRVVGSEFDRLNVDSGEYFETPYSLLNKISPNYASHFANTLLNKLEAISREEGEK